MTAKFPLRRCSSLGVNLFLVLGFCASLHAQGERTSAEFDPLREAWSQAPADSQATTAAELQAFVEDFLGSETVQQYLAWSNAPSASEADSILELVEVAADRHGVRWARARPMLETYLLSSAERCTAGARSVCRPNRAWGPANPLRTRTCIPMTSPM